VAVDDDAERLHLWLDKLTGSGLPATSTVVTAATDLSWAAVPSIITSDLSAFNYPRRARSALGVDIVLTLDVCLYVCMLVL